MGMRLFTLQTLVSALTADILSSCFAKKKVCKEEGDPGSVPAARVPCATRAVGRLAKLGPAGLRQRETTSPDYPALLGTSQGILNTGRNRTDIAITFDLSAPLVFGVPLRGAEQRRWAGGSRLALSEPRSGKFSQPPGAPSSARDPAQRGADLGVAFSLATFFWRSKRK